MPKGIDGTMSKILIVDDEPHIRELVSVFLQNEGFDVYEAGDGEIGLFIAGRGVQEAVVG
jgi:DNA-binding response OmpR family regulator